MTLAYLETLLLMILSSGLATISIFHLFQLPDFVDLEEGALGP